MASLRERILKFGRAILAHLRAVRNAGRSGANRRTLFECREPGVVNYRAVSIRPDGSVLFEGYDLDSDLERFIGRDEWEAELIVAAQHVHRLRRCLKQTFGPLPQAHRSEQQELLDLIEKGFGGAITGMTRFEEWCEEQGIELVT